MCVNLEVTSKPWPERPMAANMGLIGVCSECCQDLAGNLGVLSTNSVTGGVWELIPSRMGDGFLPQHQLKRELCMRSRVKFSCLLVRKHSVCG